MSAAVVLVVLALAIACVLAVRGGASVVVGAIAALTGVGAVVALAGAPPPAPRRPILTGDAPSFLGSRSCLPCHPGEHASFGRTFHRTMTQEPTLAAVRAPLDGRPLVGEGGIFRLRAEGARVVADLAGRDASVDVALVTGSHREQAFWVAGPRPGELVLFPFVWMVSAGRFVARRDAFLLPPDAPMPVVRWGSSCIACHAVAGEPRRDVPNDRWDTRVAELGVACEACHGPGRRHAERHRDPIARYAQHGAADATITNPRRLSPEKSAAICGGCHAFAYPRDEAEWWSRGYTRSHRPGDELERSRFVLSPATFGDPLAPTVDADVSGLFWPDGSVRVGGREYNGLVASPCFVRGAGDRKMTCTSCHAMHDGDPRGQIAPARVGDAGCTSCHTDERARTHGHHAPGSEGNACVSCHMPRTSYALLSATRSHRIASPSALRTSDTGEPNACNLCHLDRPLAWTASWLTTWYGGRETAAWPAGDARVRVAEGLRAALVSDAAARAIVADAVGRSASSSPEVVLARRVLERDPYAAVRWMASRGVPGPAGAVADLLDDDALRDLLARRDVRAVSIAE